MAAVYYIMQEAISRERLQELRVRVVAEATLGSEDDPIDEPIPCWSVTQAGVKKLSDYGYVTSQVVDTEYEGIKFVALSNPDGTPASLAVDPATIKTITFTNWNGKTTLRDYVKELANELLIPAFGRHIRFAVPHNRRQAASNSEDTLTINIWSSDTGGRCPIPDTMWDIRVSCYDHGNFGPFMAGRPIVCSEGEEVGAFTESDMYLYWDAIEYDDENSRRLLRKFFEEAVKIHQTPAGEANYEMICDRYVSVCKGKVTTRKNELEKALRDTKINVEDYQAKLTECVRNHAQAKHELDNFATYEKSIEVELRREFSNLVKLPRVVAVDFRGDKLTVETEVLYCVDPRTGDEHEIGAFKLVIDQRTSAVQFNNITRKVHGFEPDMNGPHLFPDGRACLGSMNETIPQLVSQYEWSALVQICMAFVESVNLDDSAGKHVNKWPVSRTKQEIEDGKQRKADIEEAAAVAAEAEAAATAEAVTETVEEAADAAVEAENEAEAEALAEAEAAVEAEA